jgi:hypothetical protein
VSILLTPNWGYAVPRANWRSDCRAELGDEGATKLWSDSLLNRWLNEAIRDFARQVPREETTALTSVTNQAAYDLPQGLVEVVRVEHPANTFRRFQPGVGGDAAGGPLTLLLEEGAGSGGYGYDVWEGQLLLEPAPTASGEPIALRYTTRRAEPTADTDPLPVESGDVELLTLYVCGRALQWIGGQEAKRQAFERERGASATDLAASYQARYQAALASRQRTGARARRLVVRG